jgi:hypothetical protein
LAEAVMSCFIVLAATMIFASGMPLANNGQYKAEKANTALSLARKQIESIGSYAYANVRPDQIHAAGLLDNETLVNLRTVMNYGSTDYMAYEWSNVDAGLTDSPNRMLPNSRAFMHIDQVDRHTRRVDVIVFYMDRNIPRYLKLSKTFVSL